MVGMVFRLSDDYYSNHYQGRRYNVNWGGGGYIFIYSCFAGQISFQIDQFEFDLKRNSSGRTRIYEYTPPPPPPPISVLATALLIIYK